MEIRRKGLDVLIQAIRSLVETHHQHAVLAVLIGTGEDQQALERMVREADLEDHVLFAGEQHDPYSIIEKCQVFVLPSRREGMPNVLLEAMALGVCCISTDCPTGPREIIRHGENGLLVPVEDSDRISESILRMIQDPEARERMGREGLETVRQNFSISTMAGSYHHLLSELV